jgi:plastocyanin/anti-sigma-K factor RskA
MSDSCHLAELLGAYALGCLDADESHQVAAHVATCAECRAALAAFEDITGRMAYAAPSAPLPAGLKEKVLARARPAVLRRSVGELLGSFFRRTAPLWAATTAVLLVALVATGILLARTTAGDQLPPDGMRVIALANTGNAPGAAGILVVVAIDTSKATATLYAMLHTDAGTVGTYEFPEPDAPVQGDASQVNPPFQVTGLPSAPQAVAVDLINFAFSPVEITIKAGTTVVWTNKDEATHTVTADDGLFDSGSMKQNEQFQFTFDAPGTYLYYCLPHGGPGGAGMAARVIVTP